MAPDLFIVDEFVLLEAVLLPGRTSEQVLTFLTSSPWHDVLLLEIVVERFDQMLEEGVYTVSRATPWPPTVIRPSARHLGRWRERFSPLLDQQVAIRGTAPASGLSHPSLVPLDHVGSERGVVAIVTPLAASATGAFTTLVTPEGFFNLIDE